MASPDGGNHVRRALGADRSHAGRAGERISRPALILLLVSKFVNSQAAALAALVPVALAIGVNPAYIVASAPACYGYYILPTYPSDLAAIQFDRSGTTRIGRFVINHSFILPGLIGVSVSCVFGWILAAAFGFL